MEMYGRDRRKPNSLSIDRLSELPDAILCHILSFLSTKTSVATSILSRRWRFLWAYVPNLVFYFVKNKHIIDRVLLLHKLPSLKSFSIQLHDYLCDEYQVETWTIAAIDRNVQSLHLSVAYRDFMPRRLFTCDTLVELGLYYCGRIPTLHRVCLPRLKNLYLQCVEFEDDESLPCLLSGSLVLEYLRIEANIDVSLTSCYISSPTVKWLHLESLVSSLGPREQGYRLEINTPALEYLSLHDYLSVPVESVDLTSLIAADICNQDEYIEEDDFLCCESLLKLVDSLSNVKCLKLDLSDYATIIDSLLSAWTSSFNNLTKLELSAESCFLSKFLENANNLEILIFRECSLQTEGWYQFQHDFHEQAKGWTEPQQVPKCLLSRLTTIKTINTLCTDDGLEITRYLLRNAEVLKRMDITYPRRIDSKKKNDLLQKISLFERGSKACELAFTEASYEDSFEGYWVGISPSGLTF